MSDKIAVMRNRLVIAFLELPDEAFDFLVGQMMQIGRAAGGFQRDSRIALEQLSTLAENYFEARSALDQAGQDAPPSSAPPTPAV